MAIKIDEQYVKQVNSIMSKLPQNPFIVDVVGKAIEISFKNRDVNKDYSVVLELADKVAEFAQLYTQQAYMRPLCCVTMIFAIDDEKGPQLFKVDPAGYYVGYKATAAGEKEQGATNQLEREFKKKNKFTRDDTVRVAVKALQNTLSMEFRSTDIEIAIATKEQPNIKIMTPKEIEAELTRIGEID